MKTILTSIAASSLLAALAIAQTPRYTVTDLGTLPGGTFSNTAGINNKGWVTGTAGLPDNTEHAVLWRRGLMKDLDTLGGPNSAANVGPNERGEVVGEAETSTPDPNGEDFCGFVAMGFHSFGTTCLPFLWQHGVMTALPTEGNNGAAEQINNRGEVAGLAENSTRDPACPAPQLFQFKPVMWDADGDVHELPTGNSDPDGIALGINDNGQVVGGSGICTTPNPFLTFLPIELIHALLWEKGTVTDLGSLGGATGNWAIMANNQGEVVGQSDLRGDTTFHGFLWTKQRGIHDLGTLPGDVASGALGINDRGEVVGVSADANFNLRSVLWENGVPVDLNTLIPAGSPLLLQLAFDINSRGEIVGQALHKSTREHHAFLATPIHSEVGSESAAPAARGETSESPEITLAENVRELLQQRLRFGRRFGTRLMGPH